MKIRMPKSYYEQNIKRFKIPINKVVETTKALEGIGMTTGEASEIVFNLIQEGRLK
jgi:hypothetical protein